MIAARQRHATIEYLAAHMDTSVKRKQHSCAAGHAYQFNVTISQNKRQIPAFAGKNAKQASQQASHMLLTAAAHCLPLRM